MGDKIHRKCIMIMQTEKKLEKHVNLTKRYHLYGATNHSFYVFSSTNSRDTHTFLTISVFQMCFDHLLIGLNEMWIGTARRKCSSPCRERYIAVFASINASPTWKCHVCFREHNNKLRAWCDAGGMRSIRAHLWNHIKLGEVNTLVHSLGKGIRVEHHTRYCKICM